MVDLKAQRKQIEETREYNLKAKALKEKQIEECRAYNLKRKGIKDMVAYINRMSSV